jgi:aspartyl-tRNA synthetase
MSAPRIRVIEAKQHVDKTVEICGWVHTTRDMGKIAFIEIRDFSGLLQVVVDDPSSLPKIGNEYVVRVTGKIRRRGERYINPKLATGEIEMGLDQLEVLAQSADLPFEVAKDTGDVHEELRLKYRYLDLRSQRMADNLRLRHQVLKFTRSFFDKHDFTEVETPALTKGTPEGAREFIIPSRLHAGQFYVLPQSPQQFKQLLMVAGIGRYYQIVRCFRDEDQRGDRQPEFTQLDIEMSFVDQEDILNLTESWLVELVKTVTPHKKITKTPFPRLTYAEAMEKYGTDKPDLRQDKKDPDELAFCWVVDFPMFEINKESSKIDAVHHPFTAPKPEDAASLDKAPTEVRADAYDIVLNGYEVGGGSIRIADPQLQHQVFRTLGLSEKEITKRFGHMLEAFKYGVPPHGGIAPGLDRIVMLLAGEPNIREVMAFPKTGDARDPMMGAPSSIDPHRLKDVHISLSESKKPKS